MLTNYIIDWEERKGIFEIKKKTTLEYKIYNAIKTFAKINNRNESSKFKNRIFDYITIFGTSGEERAKFAIHFVKYMKLYSFSKTPINISNNELNNAAELYLIARGYKK